MSQENIINIEFGTPVQPRRYRVTTDYQASSTDPIAVHAGETFQVSEKVDAWQDNPDWLWVWCTDQRGKSGWVPKAIIVLNADGTTGTTRNAYAARELSVVAGDELAASHEESGWLWCSDQQGRQGWVPLAHVASLG
ncbi:MAG: SH3 domain-containing protein [Ktedonobacteraceae bacterium]